jgi:hypothetical protein
MDNSEQQNNLVNSTGTDHPSKKTVIGSNRIEPEGLGYSPSKPDGAAKNDAGHGDKFFTAENRERIKRCVAHLLIGPDPDGTQIYVAYSILDAINDAHLAELDVVVHDYQLDRHVH